MEQISKLMVELEASVVNDLNSICELSTNQTTNEISDNIKLNLSSALIEIRMHIENRKRLRDLALVPENSFCKVSGKISVALYGKVSNPRSVNSKSSAAISWNTKHCLNIAIENCLTAKSKKSAEQLGLLALLNQCSEIGLKKIQVLTTDSQLHTSVENLPTYDLQGYILHGVEMENKFLLEKLHNVINATKISLSFSYPPFDQQMLPIYQSLMATAKKDAVGRLLAQ